MKASQGSVKVDEEPVETRTVRVNGRDILLRVGRRYTGRNVQVLRWAGLDHIKAVGIGRAVAQGTSGAKRLTR